MDAHFNDTNGRVYETEAGGVRGYGHARSALVYIIAYILTRLAKEDGYPCGWGVVEMVINNFDLNAVTGDAICAR